MDTSNRNYILLIALLFSISNNVYSYNDTIVQIKRNSLELIKAVKSKDIDKVKKLIREGHPVDVRDEEGKTALMYASQKSKALEFIHELLKANADVNIRDNKGDTALSLGIRKERFASIKMLLTAGANIHNITKDGMSALILSVRFSSLRITELLLKSGSKINYQTPYGYTALMYASSNRKNLLMRYNPNLDIQNYRGNTALIEAIIDYDSDVTTLEKFIISGANLNIRNNLGRSVLWYTSHSALEVAQVLINNGANLNDTDINGDTLIHSLIGNMAFRSLDRVSKLIMLLVQSGANLNIKNKRRLTVLMELARNYNYPEEKALLMKDMIQQARGIDINVVDNRGYPALTYAVISGSTKKVRTLLEANADLNMTDKVFGSILIRSIYHHDRQDKETSEIIKMIARKKPYFHIRDEYGDTALMYILRRKDISLLKVLIDSGADINLATSYANRSPLMLSISNRDAFKKKEIALSKLIIDRRANLDLQDYVGHTALMYTIFANRYETAKNILNANGNPCLRDKYAKVAIDYARQRDLTNFVHLLEQYDCQITE